jgi:flagellar biosynthesis protein FlhB
MGGERNEQPTPRRLREARSRGEVARSLDLSGACALAGGLAALAASGPSIASALSRALRAAVAGAAAMDRPDSASLLADASGLVLDAMVPIGGCALAAGVAAAALQSGLGFHAAALRFRIDRLHPGRGLERLLDPAQVGRGALALAKGATLLGVLWAWWGGAAPALAALPRLRGGEAAAAAIPLVASLALRLAATLAILGLVDLALERRRLRRALRMTRDEVRRELREDEGDPERRAERQRVHRALVEAGSVACATVVVVNPTRLAVALRHDRAGGAAPRVVAKGTGRAAARIRSAARRAGVPIVEDVPLARALHRLAEVGDEIPEELYDAAAALLAHLYATTETP